MSQTFKVTAYAPWGLQPDSLWVTIEYRYTPGRPARLYLRNGDPGYPADPAEVELVSVHLPSDFPDVPQKYQDMLDEWAIEWLADDENDAIGKAQDIIESERERYP